MHPKVINPYASLGATHAKSLDKIILNLPPNPTFDDLNAQLTDSFFTPDPNDPNITDVAGVVIATVLPNAYNGYVNSPLSMVNSQQPENGKLSSMDNGLWTTYNDKQLRIILQMLNGINTVPPESIWEYLVTIEEQIVSGRLAYEEQTPLLIAAAIGKRDHEYWMEQINTPGTWAAYLNANNAINYAHLAGIISATLQGALLTYGLIKPPQVQLLDAFTSVIGATGMAAGKVVFGWIQG